MAKSADEDINIKVVLSKSKFSINEAFELREQRKKDAEQSLMKWGKMDQDHRDVLESIVKRTLASMHENSHQWLPHCLIEGEGGDQINVRMSILLSDIDAEVAMMVDATDFEIEATRRKILEKHRGRNKMDDSEFMEYVETTLNMGKRLSVDETRRLIDLMN